MSAPTTFAATADRCRPVAGNLPADKLPCAAVQGPFPVTSLQVKRCSKCGDEKDVGAFARSNGSRDGYRAACRVCISSQKKAHYKTNCEAEKARVNGYRKANRETVADRNKAYRETNRETVAARKKAYYEANRDANREKKAARMKLYREANLEALAAQMKAYRETNRKAVAQRLKAHRKANPHIYAAIAAKRRSAKLRRTPEWLTLEHLAQMAEIYRQRAEMTEATGVQHHVDHIVPLQGKNVSGLHVPWNLRVIDATENLSKKNSYNGHDAW